MIWDVTSDRNFRFAYTDKGYYVARRDWVARIYERAVDNEYLAKIDYGMFNLGVRYLPLDVTYQSLDEAMADIETLFEWLP